MKKSRFLRKLVSVFLFLSALISFSVSASAYKEKRPDSYYDLIFGNTERETDEAGDVSWMKFTASLPHFKANDNQILYLFAQFLSFNEYGASTYSYDGTITVELHTNERVTYSVDLEIGKENFFTVNEIIELSGIPDYTEIAEVTISFPGNCLNKFFRCAPMEKGWNEIDNKQYYIKSDGTMITKSCKIGGVRYKFTSDGVCKGKYTGWTKSSKGRRYWKDGILVTNRYLRTKSGVRYYADENGYVRVCD